jgi:hypothetical protein
MRFDDDSSLLPMIDPDKIRKGAGVRAEAARLKAMGVPLEDIAEHFGWSTEDGVPDTSRVATAIRAHLASMYRFTVDEMKVIELQSLDELEYRLWKLLEEDHFVISQGQVVIDKITHERVKDSRFVLETCDRIQKVKDQRAKMMGLYAPSKIEVISIDRIEQEISKLEQQLLAAAVPEPTPSATVPSITSMG